MVQAPQQPPQQQQQRQPPVRYPQYGNTVKFATPADGRRKIAIAAIIIGVLGLLWGIFATPQSKVSPELRLLGPDEGRLVTIICSQCDPAAAKAVVGEDNYFGSPAPDRLVVRATGSQISQMESVGWVKYISN